MDSPKKKKGKQTYTDPENLYDLDGTHSVKSISAKPRGDKLYGGTPGAPAFRVGGKQNNQEGKTAESISVDSDDEDASNTSGSSDDISKLSKEELIQRLRNASVSTKPKGSAPTHRSRVPHSTMTLDYGVSSSSSSSSSGSSSSSSAESDGVMSEASSG